MSGTDESDAETDHPDEYSVGPLSHADWLVIYEMVSRAIKAERERDGSALLDEYRGAKRRFLDAHPEESHRDPFEDMSEETVQAYNETVLEMIRDE